MPREARPHLAQRVVPEPRARAPGGDAKGGGVSIRYPAAFVYRFMDAHPTAARTVMWWMTGRPLFGLRAWCVRDESGDTDRLLFEGRRAREAAHERFAPVSARPRNLWLR